MLQSSILYRYINVTSYNCYKDNHYNLYLQEFY
nr:MAG TPA: hypothetical protein [Crassvirales sp.]